MGDSDRCFGGAFDSSFGGGSDGGAILTGGVGSSCFGATCRVDSYINFLFTFSYRVPSLVHSGVPLGTNPALM